MTPRSPRALSVLLIRLGLLAGAFWYLLPADDAGGGALGPSADPGGATPTAGAEPPAVEATLAAPTDVQALDPVELDGGRSTVEVPVAAGSVDQPPVLLAGRVVIEERDGSLTEDGSGTLTLVIWDEVSGSHRELAVEGGRWSLELYPQADGRYAFEHGGGRSTQAVDFMEVRAYEDAAGGTRRKDREQRFRLGETGIVITVERAAPLRLFVQDALTGASLEEVSIMSEEPWGDDVVEHPGDRRGMRQLVVAEDSPIELLPGTQEAEAGQVSVLIGAPGYAWKKVELDFGGGGERKVLLTRGGDLVVHFDRALERRDAELHLGRTGSSLPVAMVRARGAGPFAFEGLAPGEYEVAVQLGEWWSDQLTLASESVLVVAGGSASVTLVLEEAPVLTRAPFAGTLILPAAYGVTEPVLLAELEGVSLDGGDGYEYAGGDQVQRLEGTGDAWSFDFGELQTGTYELRCNDVEYQVQVELGPTGLTDYRFEVPEPVQLCVTLRDVDAGEVADIDGIFWHYVPPEGWSGGMSQGARREAGQTDFCFLAPPGSISIGHGSDAYVFLSETIEAHEGARVTLEVQRAGEAVLRLVDGETQLPWPEDDYGEGERLDAEGSLGSRSHRHDGLWFLTAPGRYRVDVPHVEGFLDHDPVELDIVAGERTELEITLVRLP